MVFVSGHSVVYVHGFWIASSCNGICLQLDMTIGLMTVTLMCAALISTEFSLMHFLDQ